MFKVTLKDGSERYFAISRFYALSDGAKLQIKNKQSTEEYAIAMADIRQIAYQDV